MSELINCNACNELKEYAPEFVQNGVTDTVCNSMKNDTGINPQVSVTHTDCEDLNLANDCLVGRMDDELEAYDSCEWKKFMHKLLPNLYNLLKLMICAICGLWVNVHDLWHQIDLLWAEIAEIWNEIRTLKNRVAGLENRMGDVEDAISTLNCEIDYLFTGKTFSIGETADTSANAYAVAGKGVSFLTADGSAVHASDLHIMYVAGGFGRGGGSFKFYDTDFTDLASVGNFDNGSTYSKSSSRRGNAIWGQEGRPASGGELICEFRIKKSAYPQIKHIFRGFGQETGGGAYHVDFKMFDGDDGTTVNPVYAWGQHGWCDDDGTPSASGYDSGHIVPPGWWYLQLRLTYAIQMRADGQQYTPQYIFGMRMNQDEISC